MPESKQEYLSRGALVRSDLTREERRDAARRRFQTALHELKDRANPANAVRRNPVPAAGAALGVGFLVTLLRRRGARRRRRQRDDYARYRYDRRDEPSRDGGRVEVAADRAASRAANRTGIRAIVLSTLSAAIIGALRDRFIKPNIERWTDDVLNRFGWGSQAQQGQQPGRTVDAPIRPGQPNESGGPGAAR